MTGAKEEARTPEEGGPPKDSVVGLEDSLARSRRQQESRQQLCELINLNERTLASLHEMEAEVRYIRAAIYSILAAVERGERS